MKAVILAGGKGRKLMPFTATRPKPMIPIAGRPILEYQIDLLKQAGITDIKVVVSHLRKPLMEYFQRGAEHGVNIDYVIQEEPLSIGHAIKLTESWFTPGEYFLLVYGDILATRNIFTNTIQAFHSARAPVAAICLPPSSQAFGNVFTNERMQITRIVEKPGERALANYVLAGVFVLPSKLIAELADHDYDVIGAYGRLIERGELNAAIWEEDWMDVRFPWGILDANKMVMGTWDTACIAADLKRQGDVKIEGPVRIAEGVRILSGTVLQGPCYIGPGTFIGNNVLVRHFSSLGARCTVGYGVELKNCIIFDDANVGRLSFVGDSVLGNRADIGAGTMTVNANLGRTTVEVIVEGQKLSSGLTKLGAFIGDNVCVGAGHCLSPGLIIAPETRIPHHVTYGPEAN